MDNKIISKKYLKSNTAALWQRIININSVAKFFNYIVRFLLNIQEEFGIILIIGRGPIPGLRRTAKKRASRPSQIYS